jgi:hypothetical protein
MDEPPKFGPDEKPGPEEFSRLARDLLRRLASEDPQVADRLRREGLDGDLG